jgi:hypothetical protein
MSANRSVSPIAKLAAAAAFIAVFTLTSVWVISTYVVQPRQTIVLSPDVLQQAEKAARPVASPITNSYAGTAAGLPTFHGAVVDAATHLPIPEFVVRFGYQYPGNQAYFNNMAPQTFHGGIYTFHSQFNVGGNASYLIRVEADGHLPSISPPMKGSGTADFALQTGKDVQGVVLNAAGSPVAKATVILGVDGLNGFFDPTDLANRGQNTPTAVTGTDGRFHLPPQIGPVVLAAMNNKGYGQAVLSDPTDDCQIRLAPWGRIEGQLIVAGKPAANQEVYAETTPNFGPSRQQQLFSESEVQSDASGRFHFDRVTPGEVELGRYLKIPMGTRGYMMRQTQTQQINVAVGQKVTINIGGVGRPVTGRLVVTPPPGSFKQMVVQGQITGTEMPELPPQMPANVRASSEAGREMWMQIFGLTATGRQWEQTHPTGPQLSHQYAMLLVGDKGEFRIDDVIPGDYHMYCYLRPIQGGRMTIPAQVDFTVPPVPGGGYSDQPLVIPDIIMKSR